MRVGGVAPTAREAHGVSLRRSLVLAAGPFLTSQFRWRLSFRRNLHPRPLVGVWEWGPLGICIPECQAAAAGTHALPPPAHGS